MDGEGETSVLRDTLLKSYSVQESANGGDKDAEENGTSSQSGARFARAGDEVDLVSHGRDSEEEGKRKRAKWDNKVQFVLTLVGYAVGLGNIWRFSYLVNRNGGGSFLIPYFVMLFLIGIPLFYLELSLGQSLKLGPVRLWQKATPALGGIGIAMTMVSIYISLYYNIIVAWSLFYLVNSFRAVLPWSLCFGHVLTGNFTEDEINLLNASISPTAVNACLSNPTRYFWYNEALQASDTISNAGVFNWQMFLAVTGAWILVYVCLFRGVESSGKAVYITATFPFVILVILFFRAVTLEGAGAGLRYLFIPRDENCFSAQCGANTLFSPRTWLEAATQIFFSLGLAQGALISLSTYTDEKMKAVRQSIFVGLVNAFTSVIVAIVVYAVLGFQATQEGADLIKVFSARGPGLSFIAFSQAILTIPVSPLWAVLFYLMFFLLGLGSQFGSLEVIITVVYDNEKIQKIRKEITVGIICLAMLAASIIFVFGSGAYLVQLVDQSAATLPLLYIAFFEVIAISWVYGVRPYFENIRNNGNTQVPEWKIQFWNFIWKYISPILMIIIFISSVILLIINPFKYDVYRNFSENRTDYPTWATFLMVFVIGSILIIIPTYLAGMLLLDVQARRDAIKWFKSFCIGVRNKIYDMMYFFIWLFTCQFLRRKVKSLITVRS